MATEGKLPALHGSGLDWVQAAPGHLGAPTSPWKLDVAGGVRCSEIVARLIKVLKTRQK